MIPIHFDRGVIDRGTSFQRSIVIRSFKTTDFMTGVGAVPGEDIPEAVQIDFELSLNFFEFP